MDFNTTYFPCLCGKCREIVEANVSSRHLKCPLCKTTEIIPYGDPRVIGKKGKKRVADWYVEKEFGRVLRITDREYYCPKCGENNLQFRDGGVLWD
jgi:LSD1 subclass zinc finger protein